MRYSCHAFWRIGIDFEVEWTVGMEDIAILSLAASASASPFSFLVPLVEERERGEGEDEVEGLVRRNIVD